MYGNPIDRITINATIKFEILLSMNSLVMFMKIEKQALTSIDNIVLLIINSLYLVTLEVAERYSPSNIVDLEKMEIYAKNCTRS